MVARSRLLCWRSAEARPLASLPSYLFSLGGVATAGPSSEGATAFDCAHASISNLLPTFPLLWELVTVSLPTFSPGACQMQRRSCCARSKAGRGTRQARREQRRSHGRS
jgi:hypothetical protein